jgi:hypothetical protein
MAAGVASAATIRFTGGRISSESQFEGIRFYNSYGVSYKSSVLIGLDSRLPGEGWDLSNSPSSTSAINFLSEIDSINLTWASVHNFTDYYATAFDSLNNAIDSFYPIVICRAIYLQLHQLQGPVLKCLNIMILLSG